MSFNYSIATQNRFLLIFLFLSTLSIVFVYKLTSNGWLTFLVFVTHLIILFIAKSSWNANSVSNIVSTRIKVPLASISIISTLAGLQPKWKSLANSLIAPLSEKIPFLRDTIPAHSPLSNQPSILVFIVAVIGIVFINYFYLKDATAMREHPTPIDEDFPEKTYKERFISFCNFLSEDLKEIDEETNWNMENFTSLDAEVEVQSVSKISRKVTDLLNAIKIDRLSRVFLVLGDPGSGKSVSLRKLCRELLQESKKTGKVPLYINLREWEPQKKWTQETKPDDLHKELSQFIVNNLKARLYQKRNIDFIDQYFERMFDNGRFFIVLDSFDEIPAVMDVSENSLLIDNLSKGIYKYLTESKELRGILASRMFRRPSDKFNAETILEIRPFTENKVIETLKKSPYYDDKLVELIFKERQEFVPIARNPFTAALIYSYARKYKNNLPKNQAELYSSFIDQRLDGCRDRIQRKNLTKEQIIKCAIDIADTMMITETYGLEACVQELKVKLPQHPIEDVIDILKYARLGRLGSGDENRFSFVHRRFNEYFVVQRLIEQPHRVPQDAIPNDSRWRDALVLYCEVAEENKAKEIANFCWSEISQVIDNNVDMRDPRFLRMIHCLRFLKDAFRTRTNYIEDFLPELTLFIKDQIENQKNDFYLLAIAKLLHRAYFRLLGFYFHTLTLIKKPQKNLLLQKFAVEAVGLLKNEDIDKVIIKAISLNNDWISETALRSCRHLPKITDKLENRLIVYIANLPAIELIKQQKDLRFSLKLSDAFSKVEKSLTLTICNHYFSLVSLILSFSLIPYFILTGFLYHWIIISLSLYDKDNLSENNLIIVEKDIFMGYLRLFIPATITYLMIFIILTVNEYNKLYYLSPLAFLLPKNLQLLGIILLILTFFMIPYYQITANLREFLFFTNRKEKIRIVLNFLCTIFKIVVAGYLFYLMTLIAKIYTNLTILIIAFSYILFAAFILIEVFKICNSHIQDYQEMNKNENNYKSREDISREDISKHFKKYKTTWGRSHYVVFLQTKNIKPVGNWPDGQLPNVNNDLPSTLLAKLEEKWLGLDR